MPVRERVRTEIDALSVRVGRSNAGTVVFFGCIQEISSDIVRVA